MCTKYYIPISWKFWDYDRSIKVITITGLINLGIVIDLGGGPNHDRIGFRYWKNPGLFVQYNGIQGAEGQFIGWRAVLMQAAFSFIGTEIVAVRYILDLSIYFSRISLRLLLEKQRILVVPCPKLSVKYTSVYCFSTSVAHVIGLLVPSNNPLLQSNSGTAQSPFVIATETAGIKSLPSVSRAYPSFVILNFLVVIQTRLSVAISSLKLTHFVDGLTCHPSLALWYGLVFWWHTSVCTRACRSKVSTARRSLTTPYLHFCRLLSCIYTVVACYVLCFIWTFTSNTTGSGQALNFPLLSTSTVRMAV
jgi:hypothetical protein